MLSVVYNLIVSANYSGLPIIRVSVLSYSSLYCRKSNGTNYKNRINSYHKKILLTRENYTEIWPIKVRHMTTLQEIGRFPPHFCILKTKLLWLTTWDRALCNGIFCGIPEKYDTLTCTCGHKVGVGHKLDCSLPPIPCWSHSHF